MAMSSSLTASMLRQSMVSGRSPPNKSPSRTISSLSTPDKHGNSKSSKERCLELCEMLNLRLRQGCSPGPHSTYSFAGLRKSTVGMMLDGFTVDNLVIGGPAYNSGQIERGDIITSVDSQPITDENLQQLLMGNDKPGSSVQLTLKKAGSSLLKDITLIRMDTEAIADRCRMFELFADMKDRALQDSNRSAAACVDESIQLWTKMLISDSSSVNQMSDGVRQLQRDCNVALQELIRCIELVDWNRGKTVGDSEVGELQYAKDSTVPEKQYHLLQEELKEIEAEMQMLKSRIVTMVPGSQLRDAQDELNRTTKENDRLQQRIRDMVSKESLAKEKHEVQRLQELMDAMVPAVHFDSLKEELEAAKCEIQRLQACVDGTVPKSHYHESQERIKSMLLESEKTHERLRGEIRSLQTDSDDLRQKLADAISRQEFAAIKTEAREAKYEADSLKQCNIALESQISSLTSKFVSMVSKEEYSALENDLKKSKSELFALKSRLMDSGLSDPALLDRLLTFFRGIAIVDPFSLISSLESVRSKGDATLAELMRLLEIMNEHDAATMSEFVPLAKEVTGISCRSIRDTRRIIKILNEQPSPITLDELSQLRNVLRGPSAVRVEDLQHLLHLCSSPTELQDLLSELSALRQQVLELQGMKAELVSKVGEMQSMVPAEHLNSALAETARVNNQAQRLQEYIKTLVPRHELDEAKTELERLSTELTSSQRVLTGMIPRLHFDAVREEVEKFKSEVENLRRNLENTVPRSRLDLAQAEALRANQQNEKLQERLRDCVPRRELLEAQALSEQLKVELNDIRSRVVIMIDRDAMDSALHKLDAVSKEAERLRSALDASVPKEQLDVALETLRAHGMEIDRLRTSTVPRAELDLAFADVKRLATESEILRNRIAGMVPLSDYEEALSRATAAEEDLQSERRRTASMVPRAALDAAQTEAGCWAQQVERLRERVRNMAPAFELECAETEARRMAAECSRLQAAARTMVPRSQLESAIEELELSRSEVDKLRRRLSELRATSPQPRTSPPLPTPAKASTQSNGSGVSRRLLLDGASPGLFDSLAFSPGGTIRGRDSKTSSMLMGQNMTPNHRLGGRSTSPKIQASSSSRSKTPGEHTPAREQSSNMMV